MKFDKVNTSGKIEKQPSGAFRDTREGKGRFDLISPFAEDRIAKHYENGAQKYPENSWHAGMMLSRYMDSTKRHINRFLKGDTSEDHLAAAAWNLIAMIDHQEKVELGLMDSKYLDLPLDFAKITGYTTSKKTKKKGKKTAKRKKKRAK